jgi:serine/threonine protein kinase
MRGVRLGPYEIGQVIGHGATASVFEATHVALGKRVAIKLLHEHLAADTQIATRFLREGRVAARLHHPNIVGVLDVGTSDGTPYLVMELLTGDDLRILLANVRILSVEHALTFLLPIVSALAHAHEAGVIHRDLKPANIVLSRDARQEIVPKLVDFGLSKVVHATDEATAALTSMSLVAGTVLYMAPEQTYGMKNTTAASDQYSLAAIAYEAIAGRPPFATDGYYDLLEEIRGATVQAPSTFASGVSAELDAVLLRAMSREPEARWPSMRAFGRALLPHAGVEQDAALSREFADRPMPNPTISSRPSIRNAAPRSSPEAITRIEETSTARTSGIQPTAGLPCPPGKSPFHIKGGSYRSFVFQIDKALGLETFLEALEDESMRTFMRQPFLASARYDVLPMVPLFATLARLRGVPLADLVRVSTAAQVRYDAKTTYKSIMTTSRPEDLVDRIGRFNAQIYDFGKYSAILAEKNCAELEFARIPAYLEPWFAPMHVAYSEESLRLTGVQNVVVASHVSEDAGAHRGFPLRTYRTRIEWR